LLGFFLQRLLHCFHGLLDATYQSVLMLNMLCMCGGNDLQVAAQEVCRWEATGSACLSGAVGDVHQQFACTVGVVCLLKLLQGGSIMYG